VENVIKNNSLNNLFFLIHIFSANTLLSSYETYAGGPKMRTCDRKETGWNIRIRENKRRGQQATEDQLVFPMLSFVFFAMPQICIVPLVAHLRRHVRFYKTVMANDSDIVLIKIIQYIPCIG